VRRRAPAAPGDPDRLRAIAAAAAGAARDPTAAGGRWLSEVEAKGLLRATGVVVPGGRMVAGEEDAVAVARELAGPVAVKASSPALQHTSDAGALVLGVAGDDGVRAAYRRVVAAVPGADVLVEAMAPPGVEVIVAVRRDVVVPAVVVGLGGIWTELLDDVAIVPLPATPERVEAALRSLRGAGLLAGARGSAGIDVRALAALAAACGDLALRESLALFELNPVIASASGAVAVDAVARANGRP
jgi:succinyl-CoA synthetase beta subunit